MIGEHYRNVKHWQQLGAAACGQRAADGQAVTRHCTADTKRVTCAKCMRLGNKARPAPIVGQQLDLDLPT